MIRLLRLQNFKCFEEEVFRFRPLTLLSGLNGTGKSSVLQSLLLLRQSYQQGLLQQNIGLALNGDLIQIGTARDALFEGAVEDFFGYNLVLDGEKTVFWFFRYNSEADVLELTHCDADDETYESSLFRNRFHYLQAERIGPRMFYGMSDYQVRQLRQLGSSGEHTAHFLSIFGKDEISNMNLSHPRAKSLNLHDQVEAWLGEVSPGTRIHLILNPNIDIVSLQYSFEMGNQISNYYRATNVGFGITYALPVIVALLSSVPDSLILIENPEAHLHPRGQAKMGELLALAANAGIQIVVETHSDHVLNSIRVAVHDGKISPDDVQLHFFQRHEQDGRIEVISPQIDRDGRLDQWPDGFFDEWDKSLEALLQPRKE